MIRHAIIRHAVRRRAVLGGLAILASTPSLARAQPSRTGRLEVTLTSAGRLFPGTPRLELRQGDHAVLPATATATGGTQAAFDAPPGVYILRVLMPGERQFVDIPDLRIAAGETSRRTIEAGAAELSVGWTEPEHPCISARPCAIVHVERDGQLVLTGTSNPSNFVLLPGRYEVGLGYASRDVGRRSLMLAAGDSQTVAFAP
jgi:hypothetical protein